VTTIHLLTENDPAIKECLACAGLDILTHGAPSGATAPSLSAGLALYALSGETLALIGDSVRRNPQTLHVCLCGNEAREHRDFLFSHGIADLLDFPDPQDIAACIRAIAAPAERQPRGRILACDNREASTRMLSTLISRFGYLPVITASSGEFFDRMAEGDIDLLLLNLSNGSFDLGDFIRRCHASGEIRKSPLIAYRNMRDGIFVNEIISGLNRYCSYILSPEELCSFLLDILSRKEMSSLISELNGKSLFERFEYCADASLGQIYLAEKKDILSLPGLTGEETISGIRDTAREIEKLMMKISGLRWMSPEPSGEKTVTCGACG
jgi:CheY-like chemotaxis protein